MKAYTYSRYGPIDDNLMMSDVEKPAPKDSQVLISVRAVSINRPDWYRLIGWPQVIRIVSGVRKPRRSQRILGTDVAGIVEAVGKNVQSFKIGDEVYGEISVGSFAQYAIAKPKMLALRPKNLTFAESAAIPLAGVTALQAVRDHGRIKKGQHVLVNGAGGGVGHFAVQIAKSLGAEVSVVCGTGSIKMIGQLGADHVVDYKKNEKAPDHQFDVVIDVVGNLQIEDYRRLYKKEGGQGVSVGFISLKHHRPIILKGKRNNIKIFSAEPNTADLDYLRKLAENSKLKPIIQKEYPFDKLPDALKQFMQGHTSGKIVVKVES